MHIYHRYVHGTHAMHTGHTHVSICIQGSHACIQTEHTEHMHDIQEITRTDDSKIINSDNSFRSCVQIIWVIHEACIRTHIHTIESTWGDIHTYTHRHVNTTPTGKLPRSAHPRHRGLQGRLSRQLVLSFQDRRPSAEEETGVAVHTADIRGLWRGEWHVRDPGALACLSMHAS